MSKSQKIKELILLFLKVGSIAFGGPVAHISILESEIVKKRKWMTHEHFLDLVGATNLIPGPNSTQLVMHCGKERAGNAGLLVAGFAFIVPAFLITLFLAILYQKYASLPNVEPFIYGIQPAVIAIIASTLISLGKKALKNYVLIFLGILTLIISILGVNEIIALFLCGLFGIVIYYSKNILKKTNSLYPIILMPLGAATANVGLLNLFLIFLKVGALLYGSGYVLFAFLDAELVAKGILTPIELIDAVAVGQMTPGPILTTATFIGWQLHGLWGAILTTSAIFFPSFLFVAILNPVIPKLRNSKIMSVFMDAINVGVVAVILSVAIKMSLASISDWRTAIILVVSFAVTLLYKKINTGFIVVGGAFLGLLLSFI